MKNRVDKVKPVGSVMFYGGMVLAVFCKGWESCHTERTKVSRVYPHK